MKYTQRKDIVTLVPSEKGLNLMMKCKMADWSKFLESCIEIAAWMAAAKEQGREVGSWSLETKDHAKLYHPMLEKISVGS